MRFSFMLTDMDSPQRAWFLHTFLCVVGQHWCSLCHALGLKKWSSGWYYNIFLIYDQTLWMDCAPQKENICHQHSAELLWCCFLWSCVQTGRAQRGSKAKDKRGPTTVGKVIIKLFNSWTSGVGGNFMVADVLVVELADLTKQFWKEP